MSLDLGGLSAPVTTLDGLVDYIRGAERPPDRFLIGVEHEKLGVRGPRLQARFPAQAGTSAQLVFADAAEARALATPSLITTVINRRLPVGGVAVSLKVTAARAFW